MPLLLGVMLIWASYFPVVKTAVREMPPLTYVALRCVVASAFLDDEKVGKRSLFCLKAADGSVVWESPVTFNPWGAPGGT